MSMELFSLAGGANLSFCALFRAAFTVWMARQSNDLLALRALGQTVGRGRRAEKLFSEQSQ